MPCRWPSAPSSAAATEAEIEALRNYGLDTGLAFQIQDDLLNLIGSEESTKKDFRNDITEGKRTLMVVHALQRSADRDRLIEILSSKEKDPAVLAEAVAIMEASGSIEYARNYAENLTSIAEEPPDRHGASLGFSGPAGGYGGLVREQTEVAAMDTIKRHDTGPAVEDVQQRLATIGLLAPAGVDGAFGEATAAAVRAFCERQGLPATDQVDDRVWAALVDASFTLGDRTLYLRMPPFSRTRRFGIAACAGRFGIRPAARRTASSGPSPSWRCASSS